MKTYRAALLLASTLLTPMAAWADSQCVSVPDAAPAPAVQEAPATPSPPALPVTPAVAAPTPLPPSGGSLADRIKAAGAPEMTPEEIAKIPALRTAATPGTRMFLMGQACNVSTVLAINGDHFQAFTPLADTNYVCRGVIQNAQGENVTLAQAKRLPGLVGPDSRPKIPNITTAEQALQELPKSSFGTFGPATAPKVWAVIDPLCVHSQDTIRDLLPYAKAGKIQINIVPVNVISPQSSQAARVLLTERPEDMLQRWMPSQFDANSKTAIAGKPEILQAGYSVESAQKLLGNLALFAGLSTGMHVSGVPEILWTARGQAHAKAGLDTAEVPSFIAGLGG